ncbi:MAG: biotin/lipoyl-binding protein [Paenibacillaceae bacterium]|nr:biotin/lipoyl-binding protein [Paenibacillaceae bacterium]
MSMKGNRRAFRLIEKMKAPRSLRLSMTALLAAASLTVFTSGCSLLPKEEEALKPPLVKPVQQNLELYEVKRGSIARQLKGSAVFTPAERQELSFKESGGRLKELIVNLGDTVKPGDAVAKIEAGDLEIRLQQQRLTVEKARILLEQTVEQQSGDAKAIRLKTIDLESAQLQLTNLEEQLKRTTLVSTIGGVVTFIASLQAGDSVQAYSTVVGISNPKKVNLVYESSSGNDLAGVEVGMEVSFNYREKEYKGAVLQTPATAPMGNAAAGNKALQEKNAKSIYFSIPNPPEDASLGSSVYFTLTLEMKDNALVVPRGALRSYGGRNYVQILEGQSRKEVDVEQGIVTQTDVEIRQGLKEGQKIIISN